MSEKNIKVRLQQKHDTSANWALATNFKPKAGELIIYDDLKKMKVGDGETLVNNLPFLSADVSQPDYNQNDSTASDYIKNRPFYSEYDVSAALFDQTVDITPLENSNNIYFWTSTSTIPYTEGAIVQLIIDGEKYICEVKEVNGNGVIGNIGILEGADTGEPCLVVFNFNFLTQETGATIIFKEAKTTSHVQIVPESSKYLDPKYIKDMYYTETKTDNILNTTFTTTVDSNGHNSWTVSGEGYGLLSGYKHKVVYNGTTYILDYKYEQFTYDDQSVGVPYIGNASLYDTTKENTGEPFFVAMNSSIISSYFGVLIITNEAQTDTSIEITADYDIIHYIDNKYIKFKETSSTGYTGSFFDKTILFTQDLNDDGTYTDGETIKGTIINAKDGYIECRSYVNSASVATISSTSYMLGKIKNGTHEITLPESTGTLALTSDVPTNAAQIDQINKFTVKNYFPEIELDKGGSIIINNSDSSSIGIKYIYIKASEIRSYYGDAWYNLNFPVRKSGTLATTDDIVNPPIQVTSNFGIKGSNYQLSQTNITDATTAALVLGGTSEGSATTTYKVGAIANKGVTLTLPTTAGTLATQEYVTTQIGNIDTLLTALNNGTGV